MKSDYLDKCIAKDNGIFDLNIVTADIVSYSKRRTHAQYSVIQAFMSILEKTFVKIEKKNSDYFESHTLSLKKDSVVIPVGDGVILGFCFNGRPKLHLDFAIELINACYLHSMQQMCDKYLESSWCDKCAVFSVKIGISTGKSILYKDINNLYNIAGTHVNLSSRIMDLADGNQILFSSDAFDELLQLNNDIRGDFESYANIPTKNFCPISIQHYQNKFVDGLNNQECSKLIKYRNICSEPLGLSDPSMCIVTDVKPIQNEEEELRKTSSKKDSSLLTSFAKQFVSITITPNTSTNTVHKNPKTKPYELLFNIYPITQDIYLKVMETNPSEFAGERRPVESVDWVDATKFCNQLSERFGFQTVYDHDENEIFINHEANGFRLPTTSEWFQACRGKSKKSVYGKLEDIAWHINSHIKTTKEVGLLEPNDYGLFDMLGNVWEWCEDPPKESPSTSNLNSTRAMKGESWAGFPNSFGAENVFFNNPRDSSNNIGFRVVRRRLQ